MNGLMDEWVGGWMDGWMGGEWMDGWVGGWFSSIECCHKHIHMNSLAL